MATNKRAKREKPAYCNDLLECVKDETCAKHLCIFFHGLWLFEELHDKIVAHTTVEDEHEYVVIDSNGDETKLPAGRIVLRNVNDAQPQDRNAFKVEKNLIYRGRDFDTNAPYPRYCFIELPIPKLVHSLRSIPKPSAPTNVFAGVDGENPEQELKEVSMVQVFVYTVKDIKLVELCPLEGIALEPGTKHTPAKLHIHAEPRMGGHADALHARNAYTKLAKMFSLDVVPIAPFFTKARNPKICGLSTSDLWSLGERMKHGALLGDSGSNCDALVVDNRDKNYSGVRVCGQ